MKKLYAFSAFILFQIGHWGLSAQNFSLYGVTDSGGTYGLGVMYRYDYPSGNETTIINFNDTNGSNPDRKFTLINNRYIFGATRSGGTYNDGLIFRYDVTTGDDTVVFSFDGADGEAPEAIDMQASDGLLYGATLSGGTYSKGTLFSFNPLTFVQTVLVNFSDSTGYPPEGYVLQAFNGLIYGHTTSGGTYNDGVLFCYNINTGRDSIVLNYDDTNGNVSREIFEASNRIIYGITQQGGANNDGVLYAFNPSTGHDTVLINFGISNGINPTGYAYQASNGMLYGIAKSGGSGNKGLLFRYNINTGQDTIFYNFPSTGLMGESPISVGCMEAPDGLLYMPVNLGGADDKGVLLSINPRTNAVTKLFDFNGTNGAFPGGVLLAVTSSCNIGTIGHCNGFTLAGKQDSVTGIDNIMKGTARIAVFPNPNDGIFNIVVSGQWSVDSKMQVEVYNVFGEKIYNASLPQTPEGALIAVNVSGQASGVYLYRVLKEDGSLMGEGKVVIAK